MSTIVSPYPVLLNDINRPAPKEAQWWRFRLIPNEENNLALFRTDANDESDWSTATWFSWEFFDGESTILDAGMDAPNVFRAVMTSRPLCVETLLDLLCVGRPTPSPHWEALTEPGDHFYPGHMEFGHKTIAEM